MWGVYLGIVIFYMDPPTKHMTGLNMQSILCLA